MEIRVPDDLWATSMAPAGVLERWRANDQAHVNHGDPVAEVRVEDCLHEITAPAGGLLTQLAAVGSVVEPGVLIARLRA